MSRIVIMSGDDELFGLVRYILKCEGFQVAPLLEPSSSLRQIKRLRPDLLIVDSPVPTRSIDDICEAIRCIKSYSANVRILVLMPTNGSEISLRVPTNADGYLTRPLDPTQLVARVNFLAQERRASTEARSVIRVDDLIIDPAAHKVVRGGALIPLSPLEFRLLHYLASHPNSVCRRDELIHEVWRHTHHRSDSVDVKIRHLRDKIEIDRRRPIYIMNVRSLGYMFRIEGRTSERC
jgi:DNA-binding response OmpR family regulator